MSRPKDAARKKPTLHGRYYDLSVRPQGASHFVIGYVVEESLKLYADVLVPRIDDQALQDHAAKVAG